MSLVRISFNDETRNMTSHRCSTTFLDSKTMTSRRPSGFDSLD